MSDRELDRQIHEAVMGLCWHDFVLRPGRAGLGDVDTSPVPERFCSYLSRDDKYEEPHYGITAETPYGEPLVAVRVEYLLGFGAHEGVTRHRKNRAAWAYLAQLKAGTRVALYWS